MFVEGRRWMGIWRFVTGVAAIEKRAVKAGSQRQLDWVYILDIRYRETTDHGLLHLRTGLPGPLSLDLDPVERRADIGRLPLPAGSEDLLLFGLDRLLVTPCDSFAVDEVRLERELVGGRFHERGRDRRREKTRLKVVLGWYLGELKNDVEVGGGTRQISKLSKRSFVQQLAR